MRHLGAITSQLLCPRFDKIGSMFGEDGNIVSRSASPALFQCQRYFLGDDVARGPFKHSHHYYESLLSAALFHVKELPLERHVFFALILEFKEFETFISQRSAISRWNDFATVSSNIDSSKNRLDYCITGHILRENDTFDHPTIVCDLGRYGWISPWLSVPQYEQYLC